MQHAIDRNIPTECAAELPLMGAEKNPTAEFVGIGERLDKTFYRTRECLAGRIIVNHALAGDLNQDARVAATAGFGEYDPRCVPASYQANRRIFGYKSYACISEKLRGQCASTMDHRCEWLDKNENYKNEVDGFFHGYI